MKLKLTDRERVVLGWDDPGYLRQLREEGDGVLADLIPKCNGKHDLAYDEVLAVKEEIAQLATFGCDPADSAAAKWLMIKVSKLLQENRT